jgi:hypothetical protein
MDETLEKKILDLLDQHPIMTWRLISQTVGRKQRLSDT